MTKDKKIKKQYTPEKEEYKDAEGKPVSRQMAVYMRKINHISPATYDSNHKTQENLHFIYKFLKKTKNLHFFDDKMSRAQASFYGIVRKEAEVSDYIYEKFETAFYQGVTAEKNRLALIIETEKSKKAEFEQNFDIFLSEYAGNHDRIAEDKETAREMLAIIHQTAKVSKLLGGMKDFVDPYRLASVARNDKRPITRQFMLEAFQAYEWLLKSVIAKTEQRIKEAQTETAKLFTPGALFTRIAPLFSKTENAATM